MIITRKGIIFAIINSVTTLVFLINLNRLVTSTQYDEIAVWAIIYGLIWAVSGAVLGISDKALNFRGNVDVQYSIIPTLVCLAAFWLSKLFLPAIMPISYGYMVLVTLALVIASAIQYYFANKSIRV